MVVNRKQPMAPAPVISRSSSTQPVPTKRTQLTNATRPPPPPPLRTPPAAEKKQKRTSLIDRLFLYSLSLFTLYALYTCRSTDSHANPLCRSLSSYRVHVLDPYVVPPIKHALTFSHTLAEPYIESTKVRVDPYIAPIVQTVSTLNLYATHTAQSVKALWEDTLVPLYQHNLKPYYQNAVVPRYNLYIRPHIQPLAHKATRYYAYYVSRPLHIQAIKAQRYIRTKYIVYLQPHILRIEPHAKNVINTVQSVIIQLVDRYQTHLHPHLMATWIKVRPALCTGYKYSKRLTLQLAHISSKQLKKAIKEASGYRRTYVDPHIRKIWDKVAEGTELATSPTSTPPLAQDLPDTEETVEHVPEPTPVVPVFSSIVPITTGEPEAELVDSSMPTPEEAPEDISHIGIRTAPPPPVDTPSSPPEDAQHEAEHALNVAEASAHGASIAVQDLEHEIEESLHVHPDYVHQSHASPLDASAAYPAVATESTAATPELAITDAPAPTPEEEAEDLLTTATEELITPQPESTPVVPVMDKNEPEGVRMYAEAASLSGAADDEDLDDFLRDLGVEGQVTSTVDASSPNERSPASQQQQTPEEVERARAERLADTAAKRADIVGRHNSWFVKLDEAIKEAGPALAEALDTWRLEKKAELIKMSGKTGDGKGILEEIQKEGKRLLKGLETYLKKAEARSAVWKLSVADDPEAQAKQEAVVVEKDKWESVLSKVEGKFTDRVTAVQAEVHQWYVKALEHERQEVEASATGIKLVAEQAQADLGLDYAWLDDVTYLDWQRYHDLMRTFERYEHVAYAIQNGTSVDPPSPPAPLVPALDDLHNELQDIVLGFSVALGGLSSEAAKVFSQRTDADDDDGFFVVNDGQVRKDDLRGVDLGKLGLASGVPPVPSGDEGDEVRILPIDPVDIPKEGESVVDASTIVVGKDPVQIEQALKDVPLEPPSVRHEEL